MRSQNKLKAFCTYVLLGDEKNGDEKNVRISGARRYVRYSNTP